MTKNILICEDTEQVIVMLRRSLQRLASSHNDEYQYDIITTRSSAQQLSSQLQGSDYDLVLLDYFAPDGNFHVLEFEKIGAEKVIAISSIGRYNQQAQDRGVRCAVVKDNPLTEATATIISNKSEHILYDTADMRRLRSHNFDKTASS